jgi:hypothetical protein
MISDSLLLVIVLPIVAWLAVRADRRRDERENKMTSI